MIHCDMSARDWLLVDIVVSLFNRVEFFLNNGIEVGGIVPRGQLEETTIVINGLDESET